MLLLLVVTASGMVCSLWWGLRLRSWGRQRKHHPFPAVGARLPWRGLAPFLVGGSGVSGEQLRFDAIIGLPNGQCWVLRYRGPAWRVAGNAGMERMTNQIASGRVLLETLQELCGDIAGLSVRVVNRPLVQEGQARLDG